jgi:hypothetical protein
MVIDTGASISISNSKEDFVSEIHPVYPTKLKGIAAGLNIEGISRVCYEFLADDGSILKVVLENALYVPKCAVCLLCPRHLAECTGRATDSFNSICDTGILTCFGVSISVPYHSTTGLPIITMAPGITAYDNYCAAMGLASKEFQAVAPAVAPVWAKQNLAPSQRLKLMLHERCNHTNLKLISHWILCGYFHNVDPSVANAPDPICAACQYGKGHRKTHNADKGIIAASQDQEYQSR